MDTKRLTTFIDWAITKKRTAFVGEFVWSENSGWYNGYSTLNPINGVDRKQLPILQSAF